MHVIQIDALMPPFLFFFVLQDGGEKLACVGWKSDMQVFLLIRMHILMCTRKSISGMDLHSFTPPQAEWAV